METSREAKTLPRTYKPKERSLGFLIYGDIDGEGEGKGESLRLSSRKGKSAKSEGKEKAVG